jgi:hypothetical protein
VPSSAPVVIDTSTRTTEIVVPNSKRETRPQVNANVSFLVHGAEMRVAETHAVNRALRKAYGIGICSVEEIGSSNRQAEAPREPKRAPQPANGNGYGGRTVRDRLCQLIRQHQLDATLVKSYATDFCGVKTLREATREQVETFVAYLADWAEEFRIAHLLEPCFANLPSVC